MVVPVFIGELYRKSEGCIMRRLLRMMVICAVLGGGLTYSLSCSDNSTKPKPVEYRLYTGAIAQQTYLFAIDAEADTILDSVIYPGTHVQVAASPDGKYLGVWGGDPCSRIYSTTDLSILAELDCRLAIAFVPEAGVIVGSGRDTTKFFDYNTFDLLAQDTFSMYNLEPIRGTMSITGLIMYSESGGFDSSGFIVYDCKSKGIKRLFHRFDRPDGGVHRYLYYADVSGGGKRMYATAGALNADNSPAGFWLFCYDLDNNTMVFETEIFAPFGGVQVTPNEQEVYLTDPGVAGESSETPGKIFIYDANDGTLLANIPVNDLDTTRGTEKPLYLYQIRFHPGEPKAYIAGGHPFQGPGPLLVVDTQERKIINMIFPALNKIAPYIDIAPKP